MQKNLAKLKLILKGHSSTVCADVSLMTVRINPVYSGITTNLPLTNATFKSNFANDAKRI